MSSLLEYNSRLRAHHQLMEDPEYARLYVTFQGKQYQVKALVKEIIMRRKLVKAGKFKEALKGIPQQNNGEWFDRNNRSEVASTLIINAVLDKIEARRAGRYLSDEKLLEEAINALVEQNLPLAFVECLGYVDYGH